MKPLNIKDIQTIRQDEVEEDLSSDGYTHLQWHLSSLFSPKPLQPENLFHTPLHRWQVATGWRRGRVTAQASAYWPELEGPWSSHHSKPLKVDELNCRASLG